MKEHEYMRLPSTLSRIPFFAHISDETMERLMLDTKIFEWSPGEVVLEEGADESHFLVLLKGTVGIKVFGRVVASISNTGEIIGEQALVKRKRTATVIAETKVFCLLVDGTFVEKLTEEEQLVYNAELYRFLAEVLSQRLERTSRRLAELEGAEVTED